MLYFNKSAFILSICLMPFTSAFANEALILTESQQTAMGIKTEQASRIELIPSAIYPAQAAIPLQTRRMISSPLSGQIVQLNYVHGPIEKGEIIAEIESPESIAIQELFLATLSDLTISQQNLNRVKKLNKSGVSSTKKLQQALLEVKKLSLKKDQYQNNLHLMGMTHSMIETLESTHTLQSSNLQIKSPITGQLFDLEVKLGERVDKNQGLISLGETNPIVLVVRVPVDTVNDIKDEQKVIIVDHNREGIVKHIDMMVDPMTQSVDIHIKVQNDDHKLRAGQLFKVRFLTQAKQTTYKISANAISQYDGKTVVFIEQKQQQKQVIQALPIEVVNITNKQLYFVPKHTQATPPTIYIKGSTAIKAAMDAANSADEE